MSVLEYLDALADRLDWPRSRPARVVLGDRATPVREVALCVNDAAIDGVADTSVTVLLATPAGPAFAKAGRRTADVYVGEGPVAEWARAQRVVVDASEMLAGGTGGFDDQLLGALGLTPSRPLHALAGATCKLVGFVPSEAADPVRAAVFAAGAGVIGEYCECSWSVEGTGTFRGGDGSRPAVGQAGVSEQVRELRIETVVPLHLRDAVVRAFVGAHPYEEPAFDVYSLATPGRTGLGRVVERGPDPEALQALIGERLGASVDRYAPATGSRPGALALTTGPLGLALANVLADAAITTVVSAGVTAAEGSLLVERGITVLAVERTAVVRALGDEVAATLAQVGGISARLLAPLEFPGAAG